jgi:hypothetical protein
LNNYLAHIINEDRSFLLGLIQKKQIYKMWFNVYVHGAPNLPISITDNVVPEVHCAIQHVKSIHISQDKSKTTIRLILGLNIRVDWFFLKRHFSEIASFSTILSGPKRLNIKYFVIWTTYEPRNI